MSDENPIIKNSLKIAYLALALAVGFFSFKQGLSQYYSKIAASENSSKLASEAIDVDAKNAEAYKTRGLLMQRSGNYQDALRDFDQAINLKPDDYFLWLQSGYSYSKLKDYAKSEQAYKKSIELAPNYFEPKQYLGQLYLETGDREQAFVFLSRAAEINPLLLPRLIQVANQKFNGDADLIENAVAPSSIATKITLARFFIANNVMTDKTLTFLTGDEVDDNAKDEFIAQLLKNKNYRLAFSLWESKKKNQIYAAALNNNQPALVINGDFENSVETKEAAFGWQTAKMDGVKLSLDGKNPFSGKTDLGVEFNGNSSPSDAPLSQLVIVKPSAQLKLSFAFKTEKLTSGALPAVSIADVLDPRKVYAQSVTFSADTNGAWQKQTLNFKTDSQTKAVVIKVQRFGCPAGNCPAYGKLWLDDFVIE